MPSMPTTLESTRLIFSNLPLTPPPEVQIGGWEAHTRSALGDRKKDVVRKALESIKLRILYVITHYISKIRPIYGRVYL